jgi:DHA2 family multidrug resistance protein-like MFS transporter
MAAGATGSHTLNRFGPRRMVGWGFTLTAVAVLLLTVMGQHDRPWLLTGAFVLLGFGLQTTLFGAYESMLSEAPADQAGGAAAIGETSYQLGAGMGIALLGSVMNAAYAPAVASLSGVPASASSAAAHSLGEAYQVADRLGGPAGELLRSTARHSFVQGLHITLVVSAGLLLLGAVAALRLPRIMECGTSEKCPQPRQAEPVSLPATRESDASGAMTVGAAATRAATGVPAGRRPQVSGRPAPAEAAGSGRTAH